MFQVWFDSTRYWLRRAAGDTVAAGRAEHALHLVSDPLSPPQVQDSGRLATAVQKAEEHAAILVRRVSETRAREQFASTLEGQYLQNGVDAHVRATGEWGMTLWIEAPGAGRPDAYQMAHDHDIMKTMVDLGFLWVVVSDGEGASYKFTVVPPE